MVLGCNLGNLLRGAGSGGAGSSADPKEAVVAAAKKFMDLKYFIASIDNMAEKQSHSEVKFVAPDKYHIKNDAGEIVMIGRKSWLKSSSDGKWTSMPDADPATMGGVRDSFKEEMIKAGTDFKSEGEETVGGTPSYVYSFKSKTVSGGYPFTMKLWVSKATGVPRKSHAEFSNGFLKWADVMYETDTTVTIDPPQ